MSVFQKMIFLLLVTLNLYSKAFTIHTFGDSHSKFCWQAIALDNVTVSIHYLGPKLMYSFAKDPLSLIKSDMNNVKQGDIICFCFGEIDCRCHVHKYINLGYEYVIDELVNNYIKAIVLVCRLLSDVNVWIQDFR